MLYLVTSVWICCLWIQFQLYEQKEWVEFTWGFDSWIIWYMVSEIRLRNGKIMTHRGSCFIFDWVYFRIWPAAIATGALGVNWNPEMQLTLLICTTSIWGKQNWSCSLHCIYPKYLERDSWANSVDLDHTPQNRVCTTSHSSSNVLDTRTEW